MAIRRPVVVTQTVYVPRTYAYPARFGPSYSLSTVLLLLVLTSSMHRADARFQYYDGQEQYCPILVNPQANVTDEAAEYNKLESLGPSLEYDNQDVAAYNQTLLTGTNQTLYVSQQCSQLEASMYPPPPPGAAAQHGPNVMLAGLFSSVVGVLLLLAAL